MKIIDIFEPIDDMLLSKVKQETAGVDEQILLRVHSPGGDVMAGMGIINLLRSSGKKVEVEVMGLAASMAAIIACAFPPVKLHRGCMLFFHDPFFNVGGNAEELRKNAELLDKVKGEILDILAGAFPDKKKEELSELLTKETWLTAEEAQNAGLECEILEDAVEVAAMVFEMPKNLTIPEPARKFYIPDEPAQSEPEQKKEEPAPESKKDSETKEDLKPSILDLTRKLEETVRIARGHQARADKLQNEIEKQKKEFEQEIQALRTELEKTRSEKSELEDRLAALAGSMFSLSSEVETWEDAIRACGGDPDSRSIQEDVLLRARRMFPDAFRAMMAEQKRKGKK